MADESDARLRARLYQLHLKQRAVEQRFRRREQVLAWLLAFFIVLIVFGAYAKLKRSYTPEALTRHVSQQMPSLGPEMMGALLDVTEEVLPVYATVAQEQLPEVLPDLEDAIARELDQLWRNAHARVRHDFDAALERSSLRLEKKIDTAFPELLNPETHELMERQFREMIEEEGNQLIETFAGEYTQELSTFYTTLEGFRPNRFEMLSRDELAANYIHLWLVLLDYELMGTE